MRDDLSPPRRRRRPAPPESDTTTRAVYLGVGLFLGAVLLVGGLIFLVKMRAPKADPETDRAEAKPDTDRREKPRTDSTPRTSPEQIDELKQAIAEADRLDPGWRMDELEAKRAAIPPERNSAEQVLKVARALPKDWGARVLENPVAKEELPLPGRLTAAQSDFWRAELAKVADARDEARKLSEMSSGRYQVVWTADGISTLLPHLQDARAVAELVLADALLRGAGGDLDGALNDCRAAFNLARSIGDEPAVVSQLVRIALVSRAIKGVERTLSQGEASDAALAAVQRMIEAELDENPMLIMARGERAMMDNALAATERGEVQLSNAAELREAVRKNPGEFRRGRAWLLRFHTELVEIWKNPSRPGSGKRYQKLRDSIKEAPRVGALMLFNVDKVFNSFRHSQTRLRCARAAVAAERYRRAKGRWPERLDDLVPEYLDAVPLEPYGSGEALRYRRTPDGVGLYSLLPDGVDHGGGKALTLDADQKAANLGVRLFDLAHRTR